MVTLTTTPIPADYVSLAEIFAKADPPPYPGCPMWASPTVAKFMREKMAETLVGQRASLYLLDLSASIGAAFLRPCMCGQCTDEEPQVRYARLVHGQHKPDGSVEAHELPVVFAIGDKRGIGWHENNSVVMSRQEWESLP